MTWRMRIIAPLIHPLRGNCHAWSTWSRFVGVACEYAESAIDAAEDVDVLLLHSQTQSFTGNLLHLKVAA